MMELLFLAFLLPVNSFAALPNNFKSECKTIEYIVTNGKEQRSNQVISGKFSERGTIYLNFVSKINSKVIFSLTGINLDDQVMNASITLEDGLTSVSSISFEKLGDYALVEAHKWQTDSESSNFGDGFLFSMVCRLVKEN
ncbi:MAG: hypothetical protein M9962_14900 [Oligoflexia bacterium]|nr:hypothetical protein [Oligoflexia bacterium]